MNDLGGTDKGKYKDQGWIPKTIKKRVCSTFVEDSFSNGRLCQCGNRRVDHSSVALGDCFSTAIVNHWDSAQHSSEYPTDAFGEVQFTGTSKRHSHFLRLSWDTSPSMVYNVMIIHWRLPPPNLVVSVVGGDGRSKVKTWVREVIRQGLVKASQRAGAWILTTGLREGLSRCVGAAVRDHAAAASSDSNKVVALGIASWGLVHNREQLVNPKGSFPAKYYVQTSQDSCCLDNNYQAFLLVDDGTLGRRGGEMAFRAKLEDFISHQRTGILGSGSIDIPVLCVLISGEARVLERMDFCLKNSMPWLVLAGSGGTADFLSDLLDNLSSTQTFQSDSEAGPSVNMKEKVAEQAKRYFFTELVTDKLVDQALSIYQNRDLITIYHGEQESPADFDTVLLKALVGASKQRASDDASPYNEELKLAVTWNRVDIAKSELFNGDIQWKHEDLEESMTDVLINDKPQFVRLFTENGFNIHDYLSYGRLEELYCSVAEGTLLYQLLQRYLVLRLGPTTSISRSASAANLQESLTKGNTEKLLGEPIRQITLFEVSKVLDLLMGDVCQPFYQDVLGLEGNLSKKKSLLCPNKILHGEPEYRKGRCQSSWASLFIWAVLQNRSEMAAFFWEMQSESVLTALSGCKMLRELSRLESENETKLSMKELAQTFEMRAHDVFSSCYRSDESRSFDLLIRKSSVWGGTTCLQMGMGADARLFFGHDGVQALLSQIWWGDMDRNTEVWKLLLTFFCPFLCYTNFITFSVCFYFYKDTAKPYRPPPRPFIVSRWRQLWFAPVTSFLGNVLMYFLFLVFYAFVLLIDFKPPLPTGPSISECLLYFWVFTIMCEEIRRIFFLESRTHLQYLRGYIQDVWNKCYVIAITLFIAGSICRMFEQSYDAGHDILCVDYMVFTLRLIHMFAVHKQLGPKIIIIGKMMKDAFLFLFFLGVWIMAYGVASQALIYSYDPNLSRILRRVFYRPYLLMFGEDFVKEIDGRRDSFCTDNITLIEEGAEPCRLLYNNWLVVILLAIYLLVTNILLINLLIAMFSHTFSKVHGNSDIYWKFQRYNLVVQYHSRPSLAPPFIILSHINLFIRRIIRKVPSVKIKHFVLQLSQKASNRLLTWETIQKEDVLTAQNKIQKSSDSERLKQISAKLDGVVKYLSEIRDIDHRLRALENEMKYCSNAHRWTVETLAQSRIFQKLKNQGKHILSKKACHPSSLACLVCWIYQEMSK
uniref:Transient receptor potential cation channel, subfamily M, member 4 n=1 Tax=Nothobranchius furzeri TaxID=105023 RepID=A0A8C6LWZ4_NOTFU